MYNWELTKRSKNSIFHKKFENALPVIVKKGPGIWDETVPQHPASQNLKRILTKRRCHKWLENSDEDAKNTMTLTCIRAFF